MWSNKKESEKMKKLILLFTLMFSLTSCATDFELRLSKKYKGVDPELQTYVEEFKVLSKGKVTDYDLRNFSMGFRDYEKGSSIAGTCHYGVKEVDISRKWWNSWNTPAERLELVFHELGHCILKRGHTKKPTHDSFIAWMERLGFKLGFFTDKGLLYDGCPASFMHPYTIGDRCINTHFHYYINELFDRHEDMNYVMLRSEEHVYRENKCSKPKVINKTETWTDRDQGTLERSKNRCLELYGSCLKVFIKKEELTYNVICE